MTIKHVQLKHYLHDRWEVDVYLSENPDRFMEDGIIETSIFCGSDAERKAREFAEGKKSLIITRGF